MQVTCSQCGKALERFKCLVAKNKTGLWFCSYVCQKEYNKENSNAKTITCHICGKEFTVKNYRLKNKQNSITCSRKCKTKASGGGSQTVKCDWCAQPITRGNAFINNKNFCSRKCMGFWQSENMLGEKSPTWRGGCVNYYGKSWSAMNRAARARDNNTCQGCNKQQNALDHTLEIHHLKPVRLFEEPDLANNLENLITLCRDCHIKADVFARLLFDKHRFNPKLFHTLQNNVAIIRTYLHHSAFSADVLARNHCCP